MQAEGFYHDETIVQDVGRAKQGVPSSGSQPWLESQGILMGSDAAILTPAKLQWSDGPGQSGLIWVGRTTFIVRCMVVYPCFS